MPLLPIDDSGHRIQALRPGTASAVTIDATSHTLPAFATGTTVIRLVATAHCFLRLGESPTATNTDHYLPAGIPEYFRTLPGERLAVIRESHDGVLHVSEMS